MLKISDLQRDDTTPFEHIFTPGEICTVLGGNQSGKTDLCRFIAGLPSRYSGHATLEDTTLQQSDVAMVFQAFVNYPNLTVRENIAAPLKHFGGQGDVQRYAEILGLTDLLDRLPSELSGGQQQRLAIARALAKEARVLVLDEPLVNLDFKLRESLSRELLGLLGETGSVVIYATSDPRDAFMLGDEVLIMHAGEKVQAGVPMEVYRTPQTLRSMMIMADPQVNTWLENDHCYALRPEDCAFGGANEAGSIAFQVLGGESSGNKALVYGLPKDRSTDQDHWAVWLDEMPQEDSIYLTFAESSLERFQSDGARC